MKKTEVYVVVDTPKKAKKLKKLLDMFKEAIYHKTTLGLSTGFDSEGDSQFNFPNVFIDDDREWCGYSTKPSKKTEVSIKELRNILAREYLKEGDVVFMRFGVYESILRVKSVDDEFINVDKEVFVKTSDSIYNSGKEPIKNFIRYATEEENALLDPNKELEVGKWYKHWSGTIAFLTKENVFGYGISTYTKEGVKDGNYHWVGYEWFLSDSEGKWIEATPQEVQQALIEEANRRGHSYSEYDYNHEENELFGINNGRLESVFCDGYWEEPIDKLSYLKEAFNNGYCVEFYDEKTDTWKRHENPCWNPDLQWRIMVNNGHLVISDVYLLNQIEELKKSIEEIKSNIRQ